MAENVQRELLSKAQHILYGRDGIAYVTSDMFPSRGPPTPRDLAIGHIVDACSPVSSTADHVDSQVKEDLDNGR